MYIAFVFAAGFFFGALGVVSIIVLAGGRFTARSALPPATARAIRRDRLASRPVLRSMPADPHRIRPCRDDYDFDMDDTRD